ncbi:leucine-rich repeat-containing protein [Tanacetum coccineum]
MHTHFLFILSLVLLWFNTTTATSHGHQLVAAGQAVHKCVDKERQALLEFKAHLQDPDDLLSTWGPEEEEDDCCQWNGVTCNNQTGHVTELEFYLYGLGGEISHSLLNLSYLNHLDLSHNFFHGTIPMFICSMTHLTYLDLSMNDFTGTILESIGNMTQLTELYLYRNNFSGTISRSVGSLTKLEYLYLSHNSFYGTIPTEFGNLTNLEFLYINSLGRCTVENLDWLSSLSYLEEIYMDGTSLAKVNNWVNVIIGLQNLKVLSLGGCDLSQVMHPYFSSVNSTSYVNTLYLNDNNLNESMFRWLCPLVGNSLEGLFLSRNTFDGKLISDFLNKLSRCTSATMLAYFDGSNSQFTGSLSNEIQKFSSLRYLDLSSNKLNGTISDRLWQLPNLHILALSSNSLGGAISGNIGKSNLLYLDLSNNSLEGVPLIADMSNLSRSMQFIDLSSNKLGPRFPKWIQKLKNLTHLDLSNNNISETLTKEYWKQWIPSRLHYLDLSLNNISGALPESFSGPELLSVDLSFNNFFGSVPTFPVGIRFVDLSSNRFHGEISFLCQIYEQLSFLDLSHNSLTGEVPDCLWSVTELEVLNLGHNILSGRLPPSVGCLGQLEMLSLYNNSFSGELPLSLQNCTNLRVLDLGANKFSGNVPVWVGEYLSRLYVLNLRSNNFFGIIPLQICHLVTLQILDVSINYLHGKIPSCMNNFTTMAQKEYVSNQNIHHYQWSIRAMNNYSYRELIHNSYMDHLMIVWQGKVNEFSSTLGLVKTIDLSSNNLRGPIPNEVTNLHGLLVLDLSNNSLDGKIPRDIGEMTQLLTLNLSRNMFSGEIPPTMSEMTLLNDLDMSYNDLSGKIPLGTQLQTFDSSRYIGNAGLCGHPLPKKCSGDEDLGVPPVGESDGDGESPNELQRWFYTGGAYGFATGFWIVCSALLLNRRGRHAFFQFHDSLKDWVYVNTVVFIAKFQRAAYA